MLSPAGAVTRAGCPACNAVPAGATVNVGVGNNAIGVSVGMRGAAVGASGVVGPVISTAVASVVPNGSVGMMGVGVGVGRGAKLPHANAGASQSSEKRSHGQSDT